MTNAPNENIPAAILSLFYAGMAGFHGDRNTSRGDVLRGSRFFAQRAGCVRVQRALGDHGSQSELSAWQLNSIVDHIETHLADKITALNLERR